MNVTVALDVRECPFCYITFAMPQAKTNKHLESGGSWYCPNGHSIHFVETEAGKLRAERDRLQMDLANQVERTNALRWQRDHAENSIRTYKGMVTKARKRALAGVCQYCNRSFKSAEMVAHVKTKHPDVHIEP